MSSNPTADKKEKGGWILLIVPKESPLPPTSHTLRARPVSSLCEPHLGLGSIFHFTCLFPHSLCSYILQNPAQNHNFQLFHRYSQLERSFSSSHLVLWSVLTNVSLIWSFMLLNTSHLLTRLCWLWRQGPDLSFLYTVSVRVKKWILEVFYLYVLCKRYFWDYN